MSVALPIMAAPPVAAHPSRVRLISLIDATDPTINDFTSRNVQYLEELKSIGGDNVDIHAMVDRTTVPAPTKMREALKGLAKLSAPLLGGLAVGVGLVAGGAPLALAGAAVFLGGAIAAAMGTTADRWGNTTGNYFGSKAHQSFAEPDWAGRRTYEITPDRTPAIDSKILSDEPEAQRDLGAMTSFVQNHSEGEGLKMLWLAGHGMTYKFAGGIQLPGIEQMLDQVTHRNGRFGLGVYDCCFTNSIEHLGSVYPFFRYTIMSGEAIKASVLHESIKAAMATDPNKEWTARDLGEAIVAHAGPQGDNKWTREGSETLQLVDSERVPALQDALGTLGTLLTREIAQGRTQGIVDAVVGTPRYPRIEELAELRRLIGSGDIKSFASRIDKLYSGEKISMPSRLGFGPFQTHPKRRHAGLAHSPHAAEIVAAARATAKAVDEAVVARYGKPQYEDDGGIACQLPSRSLAALDAQAGNIFYTFDQSQAPPGWKDFVHAATPFMPPER
jgi:hypothetical protein